MVKRIFSIFLGLGIGLLVGAFVVRRLDEATRAASPANLAGQAGRAAGGLAERARAAIEEGRAAMAEREAELRTEHHVAPLRDTLGV
jgi:hypothetical protein